MKTCATCKHWNQDLGYTTATPPEIPVYTGEHTHRVCARIGDIFKSVDIALISTNGPDEGCLQVAPTFGCVLHEEKET